MEIVILAAVVIIIGSIFQGAEVRHAKKLAAKRTYQGRATRHGN